MLFPTIQDNFTTLLRAGAFPQEEFELEPMSTFKWQRLEDIAVRLGIAGYVSEGVKHYKGTTPLPPNFMTHHIEEVYSASEAQFYGYFKQRRYERICDEEPRDANASFETLRLLQLILAISRDIFSSSLPLHGIIKLGRYLRSEGHKVDYVKLESWIRRLGIVRMASLQAGLLIEVFGFEPIEFPYVRRPYTHAIKHYHHLIQNAIGNKTGFSSLTRLNLSASETLSRRFSGFTTKITEIEE